MYNIFWPIMITTMIFGLLYGLYTQGYNAGVRDASTQAAEMAIKAYKTSGDISDEVNSFNNYNLCISAGGVHEQCEVFMRRMDETAKDK